MSRSKAERFRAMSAECERQAELASEEPEFRELQKRLARSYAALAESEDWLDGRAGTETYPVPGLSAGGGPRLLDRASGTRLSISLEPLFAAPPILNRAGAATVDRR